MYQILLQPKWADKPNVWKEGGEFATRKQALSHAQQIRELNRTEKLYSLITVKPKP